MQFSVIKLAGQRSKGIENDGKQKNKGTHLREAEQMVEILHDPWTQGHKQTNKLATKIKNLTGENKQSKTN